MFMQKLKEEETREAINTVPGNLGAIAFDAALLISGLLALLKLVH